MHASVKWMVVVAALTATPVQADSSATGPAYQFVLRSRYAEVTPARGQDSQTGGGQIVVEQPEPNVVIVTMTGTAVSGSGCHGSATAMAFNLVQDLEIIPTRHGVRPPRVAMTGRVVGTLQVTSPGKCGKDTGSAAQGPATACLSLGDAKLLSVGVQPSAVACGQESSIDYRVGPIESSAALGCYRLSGNFQLGTSQGKGVFHRHYAVADFDPAPQLDATWADALRPFRALPRSDFGFRLVLHVVEDGTAIP